MSSIASSSAGSIGYGNNSVSLSGGISFSGLGSGADFDSMIDQLKTIEEIPKNRLEKWKADWQKRIDAFDELITEFQSLTDKLSKFDSLSTFLSKKVSSTNEAAVSAEANAEAATGVYRINVIDLAQNGLVTTKETIATNKSDTLTSVNATFEYEYGGKTRTLDIPAGTTVEMFLHIVNNDSRNLGVTASLIKNGDGYVFQMQGNDTGANHELNITANTDLLKFQNKPGQEDWYTRKATDAMFYLEGRSSQIFTSSTNSLKEVIPGLTITLTDVTDKVKRDADGNIELDASNKIQFESQSTATLTITNDEASAKSKIVEFVDAINEVLAKFQELTKYNTGKTLDTSSSSQFDAQYGSVLTGNYGVQLLQSNIKQLLATNCGGFGGDDVFFSLASIGINFDMNESSATFGLLKISEGESEPGSAFPTLDEALERNFDSVIKLFASDKTVKNASSNFTYTGMVSKDYVSSGQHSISYEISSGNLTKVLIDGIEASYDSVTGEYTSNAESSKGMSFRLDNASLADGPYNDKFYVQQGKINEVNDLIKEQLQGENMGIGKQVDDKGSLYILRENYLDIIKNIDKKIEQEEKRIIQWETRMRLKFARLDSLLSSYDSQMTANASALDSAMSNSK